MAFSPGGAPPPSPQLWGLDQLSTHLGQCWKWAEDLEMYTSINNVLLQGTMVLLLLNLYLFLHILYSIDILYIFLTVIILFKKFCHWNIEYCSHKISINTSMRNAHHKQDPAYRICPVPSSDSTQSWKWSSCHRDCCRMMWRHWNNGNVQPLKYFVFYSALQCR